MFDHPSDDRARDAYRFDDPSPGHARRRRREDRPHHMVVNDGELLDIGPDAETIDEAAGSRPEGGEPAEPESRPERS